MAKSSLQSALLFYSYHLTASLHLFLPADGTSSSPVSLQLLLPSSNWVPILWLVLSTNLTILPMLSKIFHMLPTVLRTESPVLTLVYKLTLSTPLPLSSQDLEATGSIPHHTSAALATLILQSFPGPPGPVGSSPTMFRPQPRLTSCCLHRLQAQPEGEKKAPVRLRQASQPQASFCSYL